MANPFDEYNSKIGESGEIRLSCTGIEELYWENLDVTKNCKAASTFYSSAISGTLDTLYSNQNSTFLSDTVDFLKGTAKDDRFLKDCVDEYIYLWTFSMNMVDPKGFNNTLNRTASLCTPEFCDSIEWPGNADIVGKGVSILAEPSVYGPKANQFRR